MYGDHLGSTSLITNASGAVVAETRYLPYGQVYWQWGATRTDFGFTGQRLDGFGLMDYNARYYSSTLGRFVSPDSIVTNALNPLDWDRYSYVRNNSVNNSDPSGHIVCEDSFSYCNPNDNRIKIDDWLLFRLTIGEWVIPKALNSTVEIYDDNIELTTRAIIGEEGGKLFGPYEEDAVGVAWAIRNRYESGYYARKGNMNFYWSANSEIYGNRTRRALDPIGSKFFGTWRESVTYYNKARDIAKKVLEAPASEDNTGGNSRWGRWSDAIYPNDQQGEIVKTPFGKDCVNCIPSTRTLFTYYDKVSTGPNSWEYEYRRNPAVCVDNASDCPF